MTVERKKVRFFQIAASGDILYGLTSNGDIWMYKDEMYWKQYVGWKKLELPEEEVLSPETESYGLLKGNVGDE